MAWFKKLVISLFAVCAFSAQATINVSMHQDLEVLVLNNKNVGFTIFGNNKFTLENGKNQIVVRVSKLVIKQGEKEKFKSEPIVINFDINDANLMISPSRTFMRVEEIQGFDKNPVVIVTQEGQPLDVEQQLLERGVGISRDYAAELKAQNGADNISQLAANTAAVSVAKVTTASPIKMSQDLFIKASESEKEQFTDWAFENRKSIKSELNGEGKILPMLEYWYEKANLDQRAELLTWILAH
ncbi:hypothetical protein GCM10007916_07040 [Psychromonas marina]|uniref:DUF2057 domain-containing protein n=1 Tax=Psychromonas marina TaxID=88364 RepID=A0ABQ6DX40_9GAMM|nr:DUF2057 family protein [Psychromonas marina]GLS89637.1 hypothetical protein GCM10007916_07040 [Psychromonas marina]